MQYATSMKWTMLFSFGCVGGRVLCRFFVTSNIYGLSLVLYLHGLVLHVHSRSHYGTMLSFYSCNLTRRGPSETLKKTTHQDLVAPNLGLCHGPSPLESHLRVSTCLMGFHSSIFAMPKFVSPSFCIACKN